MFSERPLCLQCKFYFDCKIDNLLWQNETRFICRHYQPESYVLLSLEHKLRQKWMYTPLGPYKHFMPYIVYGKEDKQRLFPFYVSTEAFKSLGEYGNGKCYGRTEWGPWCKLRVRYFMIVDREIVRDRDKLIELEGLYKTNLS